MTEPRRLAVIRDYDGLHQAVKARVEELGVTRMNLDEYAKLQPGYSGKLFATIPAKRLGQSLGPVVQTLGLELWVMVAEERPRITESVVEGRKKRPVRNTDVHGLASMPWVQTIQREYLSKVMKKHARKAGRIGGANSRKYMSKRQASRLARKAAKARWRRARAQGTSPAAAQPAPAPAI